MIDIVPVYKNIVKITNENYDCNKIEIMKNLFNTFTITILDYEIRLSKKNDFFERYFDMAPTKFEEDFITVLEHLKEADEEFDDEELEYSIKILAQIEV